MVEVLQDRRDHAHNPPLSHCHSFKYTHNTHLTLPLQGLINVPWNQSPASGILNSPGGELEDELLPDPWHEASSRFLSSVCTSTSLAQLCYCGTSSLVSLTLKTE